MRAYDRVVVFVSSLLLIGAGGVFIAMWFGPNPTRLFTDLFLTGPFQGLRASATAGATLAMVAGVYLLLLSMRGRGRHKPIIRGTNLGEVRISSVAVESLVRRAVKEIRGIQDVDTLVDTSGDELGIFVSVVVGPDLSIPEVAEQIQTRLSRYIADTVGVEVSRVSVNVRNVGHEQKPARVV